MVWVPKYTAVSEEQVIANVLAITERDMKLALDHFYWTGPSRLIEDLPDFAERSLGQVIRNEFPCLAIGPHTNFEEEGDDGTQLAEEIKIDLELGVTGDSPAIVTQRIMRYVRTLSSVLRTEAAKRGASLYVTGMDSSQWMGFMIEITRKYGPIYENQSILFRPATLNLTVKIRETV